MPIYAYKHVCNSVETVLSEKNTFILTELSRGNLSLLSS